MNTTVYSTHGRRVLPAPGDDRREVGLAKAPAVARGSALLTRELPGWPDALDVAALDMRSGRSCVLGQLCGSYHKGLRVLGLDRVSQAPREHGFTITAWTVRRDLSHWDGTQAAVEWASLDAEWRRAAASLRRPGSAR